MSFEFYRVLHIFGIVLLFCVLGGLAVFASLTRDAKGASEPPEHATTRKRLSMLHGIAMLIILVAGFGLMAKSGIMSTWPTWIFGKLAIFVVLGGALAFVRRSGQLGRAWLILLPLVGGIAATLAVFKP